MNCSRKMDGDFVIRCGDGTVLVQFSKEILDKMTRFINVFVVETGNQSIGFWWNKGLATRFFHGRHRLCQPKQSPPLTKVLLTHPIRLNRAVDRRAASQVWRKSWCSDLPMAWFFIFFGNPLHAYGNAQSWHRSSQICCIHRLLKRQRFFSIHPFDSNWYAGTAQ